MSKNSRKSSSAKTGSPTAAKKNTNAKDPTSGAIKGPLSEDQLARMDAWWRAANYLSVGQIYLQDNPLLTKRLKREHIKPRLLGHWGTTPGLNFIYVHLNRIIKEHDLNMLLITGPGHGGPGIVANTYLEGTYSEVYPEISEDEVGLQRLFKQFSFPGAFPAMSPRKRPGPFMRGASSVTPFSRLWGSI
nr:hypothetical protein [Verrucomicrobium spinosum]